MPRREREQRSQHNPLRLPCSFLNCKQYFRNQGGLTKHIRSLHSGQISCGRRKRQRLPLVHPEANGPDSEALTGSLSSNPPDSPVQLDQFSLPPFFSPQGSNLNSPIQVGEVPSDDIPWSPQQLLGQANEPDPPLAGLPITHPLLNGLHFIDLSFRF